MRFLFSFQNFASLATLCASVGVGGITFATLSAAPDKQAESESLEALNSARKAAGAGPLVREHRLTAAAQWQAQHIARTGEISHEREASPGLFGFMGGPESRRNTALYFGAGSEALGRSAGESPAKAISTLLDAPYHRLALLEPSAQEVGIGLITHEVESLPATEVVLELGGASTATGIRPVVWPAPLSINVPIAFYPETEKPNPAPGSRAVGFIPSIQLAKGASLSVDKFTLSESDKATNMPGMVLWAGSDANMPKQAAAFVPTEPLRPDTRYTAKFSGKSINGFITREWSFQTAPAAAYTLRAIKADSTAATLAMSLTSPDSPANVCVSTSPGVRYSLTKVGPTSLSTRVTECGEGSCAVQVFLSRKPDCSTKEVRVSALYNKTGPLHAPVLKDYSR